MLALSLALAPLLATAAAARHRCTGDCNGDSQVAVDELVRGVRIALGQEEIASCTAFGGEEDDRVHVGGLVEAVAWSLQGCPSPYPLDGELRLNHVQLLGSHNSYHLQPREPLFGAIKAFSEALALSFEYSHLPLDEQFAQQGIRQIELDVFADPAGGLYASPVGLRVNTGNQNARIPGYDLPGMKVFHVQDIDFETTCSTFVGCLQVIKAWSDAHPLHLPLMVLVELKDEEIPDPLELGFVIPHPFDPTDLDALDEEIRSVLPPEQLITPDDVRGTRATLEEAILTDGWPTLGAARGRILFALDNGGRIRSDYIAGHPSLAGRILFTSSPPGEPEAGFVKLNDPIGDFDRIQELVALGFIVRTRADADTVQARTGDTNMRDAALASGAQFVSTDYPVPNPAFGTGYQVSIPMGTPAGCNPISAPPSCTPADLEHPDHLVR